MSLQIYTNCSTLTIGCNLYTNSAKTIQAANGFYSDGTFCYTVVNGAITTIESCVSTTTSTTSTSTTTIVVNPCRCYEVIFGSGGGEINYNDCNGNTLNYVSLGASTYYQCVEVFGGLAQIFVVSGAVTLNIVGNCLTGPCPPTTTSTTSTSTTSTSTSTTSTTTAAPAYNYYTFTSCTSGGSTDYRSILSLALGDVYAFQASPPPRACYTITSITATPNTNNLPTIYGPKSGCEDPECQQL